MHNIKVMKTTREITYREAIHEALDLCLARDPNVFLIGEGVPDPKGIFGTTLSLQKKYGKKRVMDMPVSENGLTGVCLGAALCGLTPILSHQRMDFSLLSFDQIVNSVSKWHYMFDGQTAVSFIVRTIIGRGWGQGAQHSQSLYSLYAHIPGLIVVAPSFAYDVKGLLLASVSSKNPVIFVEHRWLYNLQDRVPEGFYKIDIGRARIVREGSDLTVVASSYMTIESLAAVDLLQKLGYSIELIDIRSIKPLDIKAIVNSLKKTGRLLVVDASWKTLGLASEILAQTTQRAFGFFKTAPQTLCLPDVPTPTSWKIAEKYYPTVVDIISKTLMMLGEKKTKIDKICQEYTNSIKTPSDVPDTSFKGPF